jgi:hypothetical protein
MNPRKLFAELKQRSPFPKTLRGKAEIILSGRLASGAGGFWRRPALRPLRQNQCTTQPDNIDIWRMFLPSVITRLFS